MRPCSRDGSRYAIHKRHSSKPLGVMTRCSPLRGARVALRNGSHMSITAKRILCGRCRRTRWHESVQIADHNLVALCLANRDLVDADGLGWSLWRPSCQPRSAFVLDRHRAHYPLSMMSLEKNSEITQSGALFREQAAGAFGPGNCRIAICAVVAVGERFFKISDLPHQCPARQGVCANATYCAEHR